MNYVHPNTFENGC